MAVEPQTPVIVPRRRTVLKILADDQLLERFTTRHDEGAFEALVQRYSSLVHGVCRRVLGHAQDAEDAFQATFLILARKAGTISKKQSLASWLYKVAYRTALRARSDKARRRSQEQHALPRPALYSPADAARRELGMVLDEEVQRLPEKYRVPILLCYLQGQTNAEAAAQLNWPTGTVKIRLMRGREMLRQRLLRRGITLSLAALAAGTAAAAHAAVPQTVLAATVRAALTGAAPAPVAGLVAGVLKGMCWTKLKLAAAILLTVMAGTTADCLSQRADAASAPPPARVLPASPERPLHDLDYPESQPPQIVFHPGSV
jgi:RNA polymerase sigma factor (sigma-70 family)